MILFYFIFLFHFISIYFFWQPTSSKETVPKINFLTGTTRDDDYFSAKLWKVKYTVLISSSFFTGNASPNKAVLKTTMLSSIKIIGGVPLEIVTKGYSL